MEHFLCSFTKLQSFLPGRRASKVSRCTWLWRTCGQSVAITPGSAPLSNVPPREGGGGGGIKSQGQNPGLGDRETQLLIAPEAPARRSEQSLWAHVSSSLMWDPYSFCAFCALLGG